MELIKDVPCPCCKAPLYRLIEAQPKSGVMLVAKGSPRPERDEHGEWWLQCPHCCRRIEMLEVPAVPSGKGFEVSPVQDCTSKPAD